MRRVTRVTRVTAIKVYIILLDCVTRVTRVTQTNLYEYSLIIPALRCNTGVTHKIIFEARNMIFLCDLSTCTFRNGLYRAEFSDFPPHFFDASPIYKNHFLKVIFAKYQNENDLHPFK